MPDKKFTDFQAVRDEIDMGRLLGNKDLHISDRPIHLTIYSPHVWCVSLSQCEHALVTIPQTAMQYSVLAGVSHSVVCRTMLLIDLPVMTRIPVQGQPDDTAAKLEAMTMSYIRIRRVSYSQCPLPTQT